MEIIKYLGMGILLLGIAYISMQIPYQRIFIIGQKPISAEELNQAGDIPYEGQVAGEDVPVIQNTKEIEAYTYFTVETDTMIGTTLYGLIDSSRGGSQYIGTRQKASRIEIPLWTEDRFKVLLNDMEYGRYYIAALPDGGRVIVLIDDTLMSLSKGKTIRLPIGKKTTPAGKTTFTQYFKGYEEAYGLEGNTDWYINMTDKSFHNQYRLPVMIMRWAGGILILILIGVIGEKWSIL